MTCDSTFVRNVGLDNYRILLFESCNKSENVVKGRTPLDPISSLWGLPRERRVELSI